MTGFEALEVEGSRDFLRGFVAGWAAAAGISSVDLERRVLWAEDWDVRLEGGGWRSLLKGAAQGLLVGDEIVAPLVAALESHGAPARVRSRRRVSAARFHFEFEIFARAESDAVRALFDSLPPGVTVSDYRVEERSNPEAAGLELHGALHEYTLQGRGAAVGEPGAVLGLHERCRQHERIRASDVSLELAP